MTEIHLSRPARHVALITIDNPPKLNAMTRPMLAELGRLWDELERDDSRCIVVTGAGERAFCVGADVSGDLSAGPEMARMVSHALLKTDAYRKPIVAAVNGVTAGGGFVLATMCDLRFASTEASFLSIFTKRGLIAEHGTTWTLPRLVGTGHALDLLWSSRRVEADEAYRLGLVERLTAPEALLDTARAYLRDLAEQVSPAAIADTKRLVYDHAGIDFRPALVQADAATWAAIDRPDAAEGAAALVERRPPHFARLGGGPTVRR